MKLVGIILAATAGYAAAAKVACEDQGYACAEKTDKCCKAAMKGKEADRDPKDLCFWDKTKPKNARCVDLTGCDQATKKGWCKKFFGTKCEWNKDAKACEALPTTTAKPTTTPKPAAAPTSYKHIFKADMNHKAAQELCESEGASLATACTKHQMASILSVVPDGDLGLGAWVGAWRDTYKTGVDVSNELKWEGTLPYNSAVCDTNNWHRGEPNDRTSGEGCAMVLLKRDIRFGKLMDLPCEKPYFLDAICQYGKTDFEVKSAVSYKHYADKSLGYKEAVAFCKAEGGSLATTCTTSQMAAFSAVLPAGTRAWVNAYRNPEGKYEQVKWEGKLLFNAHVCDKNNWQLNQPNRYDERCVEHNSGKLHDISCDVEVRAVICQFGESYYG